MFGQQKKKKKTKKSLKIKSTLPSHVGLVPTMKDQRDYKVYRVNGGELSMEEWKKGKR